MPRRIILPIALFALLSLAAPARAADSPAWTAWVYSGYNDFELVGDDGTVLKTVHSSVSLSSRDYRFPRISVSASGRMIAYDGSEGLHVMDTDTMQEITIPVDNTAFNSFYVAEQPRLFNQDDTALAFGVGLSDYQTHIGSWTINVFDAMTGEPLHTLRDTDPAPQALELPAFNHVPLIQYFQGSEVTFILIPDGMESGPHYASYTWNVDTGDVQPSGLYTFLGFDILPSTGEILSPQSDMRFPTYPCEGECGQFVHFNTLRVYHPDSQVFAPFFSTPTLNIVGVQFIQNGERVLAVTHDYENFGWDIYELAVIDRDGTLVSRLTVENLTAVRGVPDGFVYTSLQSSDLLFVNTREGTAQPQPIWSAVGAFRPLLVWASQAAADPTFQPWANLTPPE